MKRLIYMTSLFLAFVLLIPSSVFAHHYIWLIHDPNKTSTNYHHVSWWFINGVSTSFQSDATIQTNVNTAVSNWNTKIPQVRISGSGSNLDFKYSDSICSANAIACQSISTVYHDVGRGARYTTKSTIAITSLSTNRTRSAAHEIGHNFGLHEMYVDNTGTVTCNNSIESVMDAAGCDPTLNGPSDTDKFRIDNYLGNGYVINIGHIMSNYSATILWHDAALGEMYHEAKLLKKNTSGTWSTLVTKTTSGGTGLVAGLSWTYNRDISVWFDLLSYGEPRGDYKVEIRPYFNSYSKYGSLSTYNFTF